MNEFWSISKIVWGRGCVAELGGIKILVTATVGGEGKGGGTDGKKKRKRSSIHTDWLALGIAWTFGTK